MKYSITLKLLSVIVAAGVILQGCGIQDVADGIEEVSKIAGAVETVDASGESKGGGKYPTSWDVTKYYEDVSSFMEDADAITSWIEELAAYRGKLTGGELIKEFYELYWDENARDIYGRMMTYVNMRMTLDPSDDEAAKLDGMLTLFDTDFVKATSFAEDEIFSIPTEDRKVIFEDELFDDMTFLRELFLDENDQHHSEDALSLMADVNAASGYGLKAYNAFNSAFPYCSYNLPDGKTIELTGGNRTYIVGAEEYDRDTKTDAYNAYYDNLASYRDVYASFLEDSIAHNAIIADYEGFDSIQSYCLKDEGCKEIFGKSIALCSKASPYLQKDIALKAEALGVDKLYPFEYNAGVSDFAGRAFEYDEAIDLIREALMPLGEEYIDCFDEYVSGGYIYAAADGISRGLSYTNLDSVKQEPYIYLDYYGDFNDVLTLAHEIGHAINYRLSKDSVSQREYVRNELIDEIPPAVNQILLLDFLKDNADNSEEKIYYTERLLNDFASNVVDQSIYAALEDYAVTAYEQRGAFTGEELENVELGLKDKYYGELYASRSAWESVAHLHYGYYLYTYPAAFEYALGIASGIMSEDNKAADNYNEFLHMPGGDVLKALATAGIDALDDDIYDVAIGYYSDTVNSYEELLREK